MRRLPLLVVAVAVAASAIAVWLFPRALPIVALEQSLTRDIVLARGDSFFRAHGLADSGARTAVRFRRSDSLRTFIELAGGGHDSLNALVRGDDVAPFLWSVRSFVPGSPRESRVDFAPDGRVIGFERKLAEADTVPDVSPDSGRRLAEMALGGWLGDRLDRWKLVSTSYETKKTSARVDRTYTFERTDRRISGAPIRAEVVVAGNAPSKLRPYVEVPESFLRRYAEMRSWNNMLSLLATLGVLGIIIAGIVALARFARERQVRWREPMVVGGVIGAFALAAGLNDLPGSWFGYDTAMPATTFQMLQVLLAVSIGVSTALLTGFTLAAAEVTTRRAFPEHLDWWKLWRYRGTKDVASRVGGGYAVATIAFAYVAVFYLVTRSLFGWWVPGELLDDPNQIATPMPWVSGIAISLNAAVWEEALFRALPLSLLSLWIGQRPGRRWWMVAGVIVSALVFGFAHANYESWPPYSRGVEIFLDAAFWAVLFIMFGLLVTVVAHFVYDAVLFGIFAAQGDAPEYRVTAAIILVALLAPAAVVLWRRVRQGSFTQAPPDSRFGAWTPGQEEPAAPAPAPVQATAFSPRARQLAIAAAIAGLVVAIARPSSPRLGPAFTAQRDDVTQATDSMLRARGGDPSAWKRLISVGNDTMDTWPRFVREHQLIPEAQRIAATYNPATWWVVRYVHTSGTAAQRAEEWRIRVWPDGRPLDTRRILPDSARRDTASADAIRRIALASLAGAGIDTLVLRETNVQETAKPARRDVTVTYTDTSMKLPAGAAARAWVQIAGDEPLVVRRGIELPESFLRAERARQTNRIMVTGVCVLLLFATVITGAIFVKRRRPALIHDGVLTSRERTMAIGGLAVLAILSSVNALPGRLFGYDTSEPWGNFIATTALGFIAPIIYALVIYGLWLVLGALRRRVGIPMLAHSPESTARETLVVGLGLGGIVYAAMGLGNLASRGEMPQPPSTILDQLVPMLAGIPDLPSAAIMGIMALAIPILVIGGITPRRALRALLAVVMIGLMVGVAWAVEPGNDADPVLALIALAAGIAMAWALVRWGAHSAAAWFIGALGFLALDGLRDVVRSVVWQGQVAGVLALLVCVGLMALVVRAIGRSSRSPALH